MKFALKSSTNSARLGHIKSLARLPEFELETPHVFLYTKGGTVPHITHEVLEMITKQRLGLNIPISSVSYLQNRMKLFNRSIAEFIGMQEYMTYCGYINPGEKRMGGFNDKKSVSVWTRHGRKKFTPASYMELIENLKPDMFLLLADGDTDLKSSQKRVGKAFENTANYFEKCMEIYNNSTTLKSSQVIGAIEGGFDLNLREQSSKLIGESNVFGVVVDGLHDCSETVSEMSTADVRDVIEMSLKHIPDNKLRIIHGCWNPTVVLDLVEAGIDMFDSSYPSFISEHGGALIFPNTSTLLENCQSNGTGLPKTSNINNGVVSEGVQKTLEDKLEEPVVKKIKLMKKSKYHISMLDSVHASNFSPILETCSCLTCKNHTRAYIHHLLTVDELLGLTLLMAHNLHHYLLFISTIRSSLKSGKFQECKKNFQTWLDEVKNFSSPP